jgi:hypothetical protein
MGYYQDKDEAMFADADYAREERNRQLDKSRHEMLDRFVDNGRAEMGATIECACCGRKVVKRHYQQKFCPPTGKGKGKRYACKDRYHNLINPRGKFAHLGDDDREFI